MKYPIPNHEVSIDNRKRKAITAGNSENDPSAVPAFIYDDGTIEATSFKDVSKGGAGYDVDHEKNTFHIREEISDSITVKYTPSSVKKTYEVESRKSYSLENVFAKVTGEVKKYSVKSLQRYKHASKTLRLGIDKHLKKGANNYVFTNENYAGRYAKPHIQSTTLGPYAHDTVLEVTKDIDFISDLLVVKVGSFLGGEMVNEKIVYISPHKDAVEVGSFYTSTGINYFGDPTIQSGHDLDAGISSQTPIHRVTSKDYQIKAGTVLSSQAKTENDDGKQLGGYVDHSSTNANHVGYLYEDNIPVEGSLASVFFSKYNSKMDAPTWDGIIKAGDFVTIESWSTNPEFLGWNGEISVTPVEDISLNIKGECSSIGNGGTYEAAKDDADRKADKMVHKKINTALMKLGMKKKNANAYKYENMILKSAQNIYDPNPLKLDENVEINILINEGGEDFVYDTHLNEDHKLGRVKSKSKDSTQSASTTSSSSTTPTSSTSSSSSSSTSSMY